MVKRGVNELRKMYLDFFEKKGHLVMKSFSLVPHNDASLLLINAGMAPLKPYFTGQEIPPSRRVATCQKCVRTGDIENVGKTARHLTFFEMLGNFSFGDYFKREAISWSWEFLTDVLGMEPERLYPSIYGEDEEAFDIWTKEIGVPPGKVTRFFRDENGECDNFWEHGAGPCGPCSEIYYDRGEEYGCGKPDCKVGCDCDRFMEVWNNVFTQFDGDGHGNYTELDNKNIDTGMGLERLATVVQGVDSVFDIDTMKAIRDKVCLLAGVGYRDDEEKDVSIRLITDHIRSSTFMISDGIMPSNEGRGYVLRRLIRRAVRHGRKLGIGSGFMAELARAVINESKEGYSELEEKKDFILNVLEQEEDKFDRTIDQGLGILNEMREKLSANGKDELSGDDAFKLYDTYGFPLDLTKEILEEDGLSVDGAGFDAAMKEQRQKARRARKTTNYMGAEETVYQQLDASLSTEFTGYDRLCDCSEAAALTAGDEQVQALAEGDFGTIVTKKTPFYATMGGQQADTGVIEADGAVFRVDDVIKLPGNKTGHIGKVERGMIRAGDEVRLEVDADRRLSTAKNHSATHLLQKALQLVLGPHVEQAGSYVDADRLRFDFSHFSAMTPEEIKKTEGIVNEEIAKGLDVRTDIMSLEDAKKSGATALFGEKYGEEVRVVRMGDFSAELCGGTHVSNTSAISRMKIISESGVAAGVRRIEALTGDGLIGYYEEAEGDLRRASDAAKAEPGKLADKILGMRDEIRELKSENEKLKAKIANKAADGAKDKIQEINGVRMLAMDAPGTDMGGLRNLGDRLKGEFGADVVVLASESGGKAVVVAMASDGAVKKGVHAGNLIKEIAPLIGGGGGGRPNMAQAGGANPSGVGDALLKAAEIVKEQTSQK